MFQHWNRLGDPRTPIFVLKTNLDNFWGIKTCLGCVVCLDYEDKLAFCKTKLPRQLAFCKTKLPRQTCFLQDKTVKTNLLLARQNCLDKLAYIKTICQDRLCFYQDNFSRQT